MYKIFKYEYDSSDRQYLKYKKVECKTIIPKKSWASHGKLVDTKSAGNGYHGRCCNCGLALETDLGYNSWDGTNCTKKEEVKVEVQEKRTWWRNPTYATTFASKSEAYHQRMVLVRKQGWGQYNFMVEDESGNIV